MKARDEDVPEHTLFIITTDGMENASRRYTTDDRAAKGKIWLGIPFSGREN